MKCSRIIMALTILVGFQAYASGAARVVRTLVGDSEEEKQIEVVVAPSTQTYTPRGLLIFLDDTEVRIEAFSMNLLTALSQNAGPIIISASLLKNVVSEYDAENKEEKPLELIKKYNSAKLSFGEAAEDLSESRNKIVKYSLLKASKFDPTQWVIKVISDSLYLLIPRPSLADLKIASEKIDDPRRVSDTELTLGLKIDHMDTITIDDVIGRPIKKHDYATYFVDALYNWANGISSIFCTRSDYYRRAAFSKPIWSIYLGGHGLIKNSIAGLLLSDFRKFLDFLQHKIDVKLLVYSSCYAAGLNTELIYKDATSALQKAYSFPIVTQALTDAPTTSLNVHIERDGSDGVKLVNSIDFAKFLNATQTEIIRYDEVIKHLLPIVPTMRGINYKIWGDAPQIKFPGLEWFSVMASQKDIVSIGSILSRTRDEKEPLDVVRFFKTEPKAILLYAKDVPFELVIDSKEMEAMISMVPGDALHTLKKISSSQQSIDNILSWFMRILMLAPQKVFFIKELSGMSDGTRKTVNEVLIYSEEVGGNYLQHSFYVDGETLYQKDNAFDDAQVATNTSKIKLYNELKAKAKGQLNTLGFLTVALSPSGKPIGLAKINTSSVIEKIQGRRESVAIFDIFTGLRNALSPGAIVWVKEIVGAYDEFVRIPGKKWGEPITITDVIVEQTGAPYCTHDGKFYHGREELKESYLEEQKKRMALAVSAQREGSLLPSQTTRENLQKIKEFLYKRATAVGRDRSVTEDKKAAERKEAEARAEGAKIAEEARKKRAAELKEEARNREEPERKRIEDEKRAQLEKEKKARAARELSRDDAQEFRVALHAGHFVTKPSYVKGPTLKDVIERVDARATVEGDPLLGWVLYNGRWVKDHTHFLEIVRLLLSRGADVNAECRFMGGILNAAVYSENLEVVKAVIAAGAIAHDKEDLLGRAIDSSPEIASWLITQDILRGVNVNASWHGTPLLHFAVDKKSNLDVVTFLLDRGADINAKDRWGMPVLAWAISSFPRNLEIIKLLIARGADVNAVVDGKSLLHRAVSSTLYVLGDYVSERDLEIIRLLVQAGARVSSVPEEVIAVAPARVREILLGSQ